MKILIIDDEPAVRRSLARALSLRKHEIRESEDGVKGLEEWKNWRPNVVLLDVLMPGLSGPAVLKEIGTNHEAKVILMSAYAGDYDLEKAKSMGANHFVAKPFADIFAIVDIVERMGSVTE